MEKYNPQKIESKWQKYWSEHLELYSAVEDSAKEKRFILDMFPYPSGEGLHVGHVESYTATDIISRYLRMNGKNVMHPQGFDAFGLPAENYAIKTGVHPSETTKKAIANFTSQMNRMGFSYDWSRMVNSSTPEYYKWTQWFFLLLYKNGLAEKKKAKVNWCDNCKTVLANEQVEDGNCERCKNPVVQKDLEQWFFKITDFIESQGDTSGLLEGLAKVDWPDSTKAAQKNWIGKSFGAQFTMKLEGVEASIEVFTTRLDTVFGMTYAVVAPEHKIISKIKSQISNLKNKEDIIDLGYVEDEEKFELLKKADVFLFPTLYEGFGLPVLEAQSVGTPVVTSNTSSLPEIAGSGALLVDPLSSESIAEAAYRLISDKVLRNDIINRGLGNVKKFGWDKCATEIDKILKNQ